MSDVEKEIAELKKRKRNGLLYGGSLLALGIASLLAILAIFQLPVDLAPYILAACLSISFVGVIYLYYVGDTAKNLLRSVEIIKRIEPDELVVTKDFVLGRKGKIYLLTKRTAYMLSLIKFNDLIETDEKKIKLKLPKTKFAKSKKIAGAKVYYSKGRPTIPISKDKYATGEAIIYSMDTETVIPTLIGPPIARSHKYKRDVLLEIIEELNKEVI